MSNEDIPTFEITEEDDLNAEKELSCAKEAIEKESWAEVDGCLNKFLIKFQQQDNSPEDVKKFKEIFLEVKNLVEAKNIPEEDKNNINSSMEHILKLLELK